LADDAVRVDDLANVNSGRYLQEPDGAARPIQLD
jgi:hypothetical protein